MTVDPAMLEAEVRAHLNLSAPRTMVVLEPLKVTLTNIASEVSYELTVPNVPDQPEKGSHPVTFGRVVYIEREDFKSEGEKGFRRLTKDQGVGLKHAGYVIKLTKVISDNEIEAEATPVEEAESKPKAFIHWVSDPVEVTVRLYERLFKHKNPEDPEVVPGGFLEDVNRDSKRQITALADRSILGAKNLDKFQFERQGYFSVDEDSEGNNLVFNRTVSLKEDSNK